MAGYFADGHPADGKKVPGRKKGWSKNQPQNLASEATGPLLLDRQPPFDLQAEIGVLGSMILSADAADDAVLKLKPEDFFDNANEILYRAMAALHAKGKPLDPALLVDALKTAGDYEKIGGAGYLSRIINGVPNASHCQYYAGIVHGLALQRATIAAAAETLAEAYDRTDSPLGVVERAEARMFGVMERGLENESQLVSLDEAFQQAMARMEARHAGDFGGGVRFGLPALDAMLGGLKDSELTVLGGRPSNGKTALAIGLSLFAAHNQQVKTLFVSLEMSRLELADRMLTMFAEINSHRMQTGSLTLEERQHLVGVASNLGVAPIWIEDAPTRTVAQISALARRHKRKQGLGLLIIDYLQLIEPDDHRQNREQQVATISRRLKILARELKIPVVVAAQVNRQSDQKNECPRLANLRESGAIEQDADVVIFVHRPAVVDFELQVPAMEGEPCEVTIAKQRNGPTGPTEAFFFRGYSAFKANAAGDDAHHHAPSGTAWNPDAVGAGGTATHGTHPTHAPSF